MEGSGAGRLARLRLERSREPGDLARLKQWNARLSALRWLLGAWDAPVLPEYVGFNVTTRCNLSCPHCPSHGTPAAKRAHNDAALDMPAELWRSLAAQLLPFAGLFSLTLTGEPLALPGLEEWLGPARASGARLHLVTNGTLLTPRRIAQVLPLAAVIQLSVDGASPAAFEALRRGATLVDFAHRARLLSRVGELLPQASRPRLGLTCVGMRSNLLEWPRMVRLARALGYDWLQIGSFVAHFPDQGAEQLDRHQALFNHFRAETVRLGGELGVEVEVLRQADPGVAPDPTTSAPAYLLGAGPSPPPAAAAVDGLYDPERVEAQTQDCLRQLRLETARPSPSPCRPGVQARELNDVHRSLCSSEASRLAGWARQPGESVWHCVHLRQRMHVRFDGSVYACPLSGGENVGSLAALPARSLWNGPVLSELRARFATDEPPSPCRGCHHRRRVPAGELLRQAGFDVSGTSVSGAPDPGTAARR